MPKDPTKRRVHCRRCRGYHNVTKGSCITCPNSMTGAAKSGWYILVGEDGKVTQTSHYENIEHEVKRLIKLRAQRAAQPQEEEGK